MSVSGDVVMVTVTVPVLIAASRSHLIDQYLIYFFRYWYVSVPFAKLFPSFVKNFIVE